MLGAVLPKNDLVGVTGSGYGERGGNREGRGRGGLDAETEVWAMRSIVRERAGRPFYKASSHFSVPS